MKAASSLKAELGIWMSPGAKTYKRGLERERGGPRKGNAYHGEVGEERERERDNRTVNPFLSSWNEASKESLLFRETHLTFHPQSRRVATFRFSSALSRIFCAPLRIVWPRLLDPLVWIHGDRGLCMRARILYTRRYSCDTLLTDLMDCSGWFLFLTRGKICDGVEKDGLTWKREVNCC